MPTWWTGPQVLFFYACVSISLGLSNLLAFGQSLPEFERELTVLHCVWRNTNNETMIIVSMYVSLEWRGSVHGPFCAAVQNVTA